MVKEMRLIILAAGQGTRLAPLTDNKPKCMVELGGLPIMQHQINVANKLGIEDIVIVGGYKVDCIPTNHAIIVVNKDFFTTNMVYSLFCAAEYFDKNFIVSYGDIVYSPKIFTKN